MEKSYKMQQKVPNRKQPGKKVKKITLIENPGLQIVWCLAVGLAKSFRPIFGNFL